MITEKNDIWLKVADGLPKVSGEYLVITYTKPSIEQTLYVDLEQAYGLNFLESNCTHYRLKKKIVSNKKTIKNSFLSRMKQELELNIREYNNLYPKKQITVEDIDCLLTNIKNELWQ